MTLSRFSLLVLVLAAAGCGRGADPVAPAAPVPPAGAAPDVARAADDAAATERVWMGVLPCADCDGIQTRLTLLSGPDGRRYRLQETYLHASGSQSFDQAGEWAEDRTEMAGEAAALYRLDPQGAGRWFWQRSDGALEQLLSRDESAAGGVEYRLQPM